MKTTTQLSLGAHGTTLARTFSILALLASSGAAGCAEDSEGSEGADEGPTPGLEAGTVGADAGGGETAGAESGADDAGAGTGEDDETGGPRLDVGDDGAGEVGDGDDGCNKVDLLFVIDNSGSMLDEQSNLINAFPGFIEGIQTELADRSVHVGVVTSDAYAGNEGPCADTLGALVTQTDGRFSSHATCGPWAEGRYMTEADDLAEGFACAGMVGIEGDGNERPMDAMRAALGSGLGASGACNEGFARDDALLVIVLITDEEDDVERVQCHQLPVPGQDPLGSSGSPETWFDEVVAARGGREQNVVVLSLAGPVGPDPEVCPELDKCSADSITGAEAAERIVDFTQRFTFGIVGRVCEPTYATFFGDAVGSIKDACEGFMPAG